MTAKHTPIQNNRIAQLEADKAALLAAVAPFKTLQWTVREYGPEVRGTVSISIKTIKANCVSIGLTFTI